MVAYTKCYEKIPEEIRSRMIEYANVYYCRDFYCYNVRNEEAPMYFWDESQVLVILVHRKAIFRYALMPTEPFEWSEKRKDSPFLDQVVDICRTEKLDWMGPTDCGALFKDAPSDSVSIPFGSYIIDLTLSEEKLWRKVHSKHRNVIRNAEKLGVKVVYGGVELLDDYMKVDRRTWERSNLHKNSRHQYITLFKEFKENVRLYLAYFGEKPQGGAIILLNKAMAYYSYGATEDNPVTGAMNYLQWQVILDCKKMGIKKYSFVGCRINEDVDSKYHGIQRFKERFGGELVVGRMFKVILNPWKYRLFQIAVRLKSGQWPKDIIDQEIHKWGQE